MNTDTKYHSSDIDDRIAKLTTIVEQLVSTMGQDRERYDKLMVEISWIQSWTRQTFFIIGLFLSAWAYHAVQQY